jgi:phosphate acetyltransferase
MYCKIQKGDMIMDIMNEFWKKAKSDVKRIVLPEGEEERNILASATIKKRRIGRTNFIGKC